MIGANLLKATERRRPLRPERRERKKVTAQAIKDNDLKILVSITRALYVPTRITPSGYVLTSIYYCLMYRFSLGLSLAYYAYFQINLDLLTVMVECYC